MDGGGTSRNGECTVTVTIGHSLAGPTMTNGQCALAMPLNWSGVLRPWESGFMFEPFTRTLTGVTENALA